jgi:hypothetical protein
MSDPWQEYREQSQLERDAGAAAARRPSPGKVTLTSRLPAIVHRKAKGPAAAGGVGTVLDSAARESRGESLPGSTQVQMELGFGQSLSDVRVHSDAPAAAAAADLNARAFTAGNDVYFNKGAYQPQSSSGQRLLAHELAHVVQGGAVAASAHAGQPSLSSPGDAAEIAADRAADAIMRGDHDVGGKVGSAPRSTVHRDALGDLDSTSQGDWLGSVDTAEALQRVEALSTAEKEQLISDESQHPTVRRLMQAFSTAEILQVFFHVPQFDLRWRLYWIDASGKADEFNENQWRWLIGYATPEAMESVRAYPAGYRIFLNNAPADLVPAWDRLQGLEDGNWNGDALAIRNAVNQLNAAQKQRVRDDQDKMRLIMDRCGDANEQFRVITYLDSTLSWSVYWLITCGALPSLTDHQWAELLMEAPRSEYDALVAYPDGWRLTQEHCPASLLQVTRQNSDPATAATALADPVQVSTLFSSLGPAGFLAMATQLDATVDANYVNINNAGKVVPTVDGLETGPKMGTQAALNLKKWFLTPSATDVPTLEKMFVKRFRIQVTGTGSYNHTRPDASGNPSATLGSWTKQGLMQAWQVCEALPPSAVEQNERLYHMLRDTNRGPGSAYYAGPRQGADGDVLMGYRNDAELGNGLAHANSPIYQAGGAGPGSPQVDMSMFNATMRHEIGHAVDAQMGIMESWGRQAPAGGWTKYSSYDDFVSGIITAAGGMSYGANNALYRQAMVQAVTQNQSFSAALTALGGTPPAADPGGAVSVVWQPARYRQPAPGQNGPWYSGSWVTRGGRNFQDAYGQASSLYSFLAATRTQRMVTDYQWRAPGEWFAEVYQVYYSEQEIAPDAPVGGRLRAKDPEAANMIHNLVDQGHSAQGRPDGTSTPAPGTGTP